MGERVFLNDDEWRCYSCDGPIEADASHFIFTEYGPPESDQTDERELSERILCLSCGTQIERQIEQLTRQLQSQR